MKQEEDFYWQSNSRQAREDEISKRPFLYDHQYSSSPREKVFPRYKRPALILRVALATVSVISVLIALEVVLTIHGVLYDNNADPAGNTHFNLNVVFVLFVFFVVLANVLYNRKR